MADRVTTAPAGRCRLPDCVRSRARRSSLCGMHRERLRRHGDVDHNEWTTADLDDVAAAAREERLLPGMTRRERILLGLALTDRGLSASEVARITRVTGRTVTRWRRARRAEQRAS